MIGDGDDFGVEPLRAQPRSPAPAAMRAQLSGTNLERAANHNQRITLHAIRVNGSLTRIDLAEITGLTPPAIANITKKLLAEGLIKEAGQRRGGRGQPPTKLVIDRNACFSLGVNIDRDHITMVIVDFMGQTIARISREMDFPLPSDVRTFYQKSIDNLLREAAIDHSRMVGIGVAMPDDLGLIDLPGRPESYGQWETVNIAELFAGPLDLPVFVENDAAAAAMGELQLGFGQKCSSFFYILISSALGGGLVVDGSYFRGADGRSGELGFLLGDNGRGGREQIQHFVSRSGLAGPLEAAGFGFSDLAAPGERHPAMEAVIDAWIGEAVQRLIEPLIAVNCLINPAAILIGGRLPGPYFDRLARVANQHLRKRAVHVPVLAPVERAMLSEDAPAVGAAIVPFSHFLLPRTNALWKGTASIGYERTRALAGL